MVACRCLVLVIRCGIKPSDARWLPDVVDAHDIDHVVHRRKRHAPGAGRGDACAQSARGSQSVRECRARGARKGQRRSGTPRGPLFLGVLEAMASSDGDARALRRSGASLQAPAGAHGRGRGALRRRVL